MASDSNSILVLSEPMEIEQPQRLKESEPTEHFESEPMEESLKIEEEEDTENQWADLAEMEAELRKGKNMNNYMLIRTAPTWMPN